LKRLTKEQLSIIKSDAKNIEIQALAGYGKTYTLIQKCLWHIKQSKVQQKILYIVFNDNIKQTITKEFQTIFKKNFKKYKSKSILSSIEIKTTYELSRDILRNKIGHFEINQFDLLDIKNFLYSNKNTKYSNLDIKTINKKLHIYYNSTDTITKQLQDELDKNEEEKDKIAYIYEGVIAIIDAQMKLLFHINKDACLKLSSSIDTKDMYYDIAIVDEAQDTNAFILKIFLDINSNRKIISGDRFSHIYSYKKSINILGSLEHFTSYPLTISMRFPKKACDYINKILYKLSRKTQILGENKEFITDKETINKKNGVHIYANKSNMLSHIYKSALSKKKIHIVGEFIREYKDFIAMCYICSDFNEEFITIIPDIKQTSEIFLKFETISNYIELTNNQTHKDYYILIQKWLKGQNQLIDKINLILSQCTPTQESNITYCLAVNAKAREFEYVVIANDFIDYTKIHKPNTQETQELQLLYTALSRCTKGLYREELS